MNLESGGYPVTASHGSSKLFPIAHCWHGYGVEMRRGFWHGMLQFCQHFAQNEARVDVMVDAGLRQARDAIAEGGADMDSEFGLEPRF